MCKRKSKSIRESNNYLFTILIGVQVLFVFVFGACAFFKIPCPEELQNAIGVAMQIITALATVVISIIGISISLQNEEVFGTKTTKLYNLRLEMHYSVKCIVIIPIALCTLSTIFYLGKWFWMVLGMLAATVVFLLQVVCSEVPIMMKNHKAIINILKGNLVRCYLNVTEAEKDLKDPMRYLLYRETINQVYKDFKDSTDDKYNTYLILKLLEYQCDLAGDLIERYSDAEKAEIASSLLDNVCNILYRSLEEVSDEAYISIEENKHLLIYTLFRIHELPSMQKRFDSKICSLTLDLSFAATANDQRCRLIADVLIVLSAASVEMGDLSVVKAIRHQLSEYHFCLEKECYALEVFNIISMHLYYLCCSEPNTTEEVKNKIQAFIAEDNVIEGKTRITSWKRLFGIAAEAFNVDYDKFVGFVTRNSDVLENYQYGCGAKWVVLTHFYLTQWYLTQLLNAGWERSIDIANLAKSYPDIKRDLKMFGNNCFDDMNFTPTQEMENIIDFYGSQKNPFARFKLEEGRNHTLFDVVNSIKLEELKENEKKAQEIDNDAFSDMIFRSAEEAIKSEWGFDSDLAIENEKRYFSVLFEKCPEAINFNESVTEWIIASIIMDIKGSIKKTILKNDGDYEENANTALHKNIKYITPAIKGYIQSFYSNNPQVKDKFLDIFEHCDEIKSKLLSMMAMVTENGFRFNCSIEKVEVRALSEDELSKTVAEYQRADGQFVYNGIFMPREKIVETIKSKYVVLLIVVKHQVESSEDTVFELDF